MAKEYQLNYRKLEWKGTLSQILSVIKQDLVPNIRKYAPIQIVITEIKPESKPEPKFVRERPPTPFMPFSPRASLFEGLLGTSRASRRKRYLKRASLKELQDEIKSRKKLKKNIKKKTKRKRR